MNEWRTDWLTFADKLHTTIVRLSNSIQRHPRGWGAPIATPPLFLGRIVGETLEHWRANGVAEQWELGCFMHVRVRNLCRWWGAPKSHSYANGRGDRFLQIDLFSIYSKQAPTSDCEPPTISWFSDINHHLPICTYWSVDPRGEGWKISQFGDKFVLCFINSIVLWIRVLQINWWAFLLLFILQGQRRESRVKGYDLQYYFGIFSCSILKLLKYKPSTLSQ